MSLIMLSPQKMPKETRSDYLARLAHIAFVDKKHPLSKHRDFFLMLDALEELDKPGKKDNNPFVNGHKMFHKKFNLPRSVLMDLDVHPYGEGVRFADRFSTLDSFAVFGETRDSSKSGIIVDFYHRMPTKTVVFVEGDNQRLLESISSSCLEAIRNNRGRSAYSRNSLEEETFKLQKYGLDPIRGVVERGELIFGGKGRPQGSIVKKLVESIGQNNYFRPVSYHLLTHEFEADFSFTNGKPTNSNELDRLAVKVKRVYDNKAKQVA